MGAAGGDGSRRDRLRLIGYPERAPPRRLLRRIKLGGAYADKDLPDLLAKVRPHVVWFPAQWPETWSYTLSAAIDAGLPIVASRIGAFPERLEGRPLTWLIDPAASTETWRAAFAEVRAALRSRKADAGRVRAGVRDFYATEYLRTPPAIRLPQDLQVVRRRESARVRADTRLRVIAVPERFDATGVPTPCAYIRLLQPLHRLAADLEIIVAHPEEALDLRGDILVTHRHAIADVAGAAALAAHCRATGMRLLYDLDDDLTRIPHDHADVVLLKSKAPVVRRLLADSDAVWVSTAALAPLRADARIVPNGLDERLWLADGDVLPTRLPGPVRIVFMGTITHGEDFALVRSALARLHARFGARIAFDLIGVTADDNLPSWMSRLAPDGTAGQSYPGFVEWVTRMPAWDIGIAPLADTAFNRAKSAIKALDYAALGLAVLASDVAAYRGSGAALVANTEAAWVDALDHLIRHPRDLARAGRAALTKAGTLGAQHDARLAAWHEVARSCGPVAKSMAQAGSPLSFPESSASASR